MHTNHNNELPLDPIEVQLMDDAQAGAQQPNSMRGRLPDVAAVRRFIEAGKATLTIVSKKTGTRFTLKYSRPPASPTDARRPRPIWVSVLSGADNEKAYTFLGTMWCASGQWSYRHSPKSTATASAPSVEAVLWLMSVLNSGREEKLAQAEVWHEGRCGRCGRKLTVPSSIESGFGPECINYVH